MCRPIVQAFMLVLYGLRAYFGRAKRVRTCKCPANINVLSVIDSPHKLLCQKTGVYQDSWNDWVAVKELNEKTRSWTHTQ